MSKKLLVRTFTAALMVVAFILVSAGPTWAEPKQTKGGSDPCTDAWLKCWENAEKCQNVKRCQNRCSQKVIKCVLAERPTQNAPPTSQPKPPGKNTGVLDPANVGVKPPDGGNGSPPKGNRVLEPVNVGKKPLDGGNSSGATIQHSNVRSGKH